MLQFKRIPIITGCGLYVHICHKNNRPYYGESGNLPERIGAHISDLRGGTHICKELQEDWLLFGEEQFEFYIIDFGPAYESEQYRRDCETKLIKASPITPYNISITPKTNHVNKKEVVIQGVVFPTIAQAAKATGQTVRTVSYRLENNTLDTLEIVNKDFLPEAYEETQQRIRVEGKDMKRGYAFPISVNGEQFPSIGAARKKFNIGYEAALNLLSESTNNGWYYVNNAGEFTKTPPEREFPSGARAIYVGETFYESIALASKALNTHPATIRKRLLSKNYPDWLYQDEYLAQQQVKNARTEDE